MTEWTIKPQMIRNLLTPIECKQIINFHKNHRHLERVGDGSDYWGIRFMHIHNQQIRDTVWKAIYNLIGEIKLLNGQTVWPEMVSINEWPIGGVQKPHLDTYSSQETLHGTESAYPARQWTCILYLNDDFKGGRTYIPEHETYEPEIGSGLLFQGIYIPHGVEKVRRNSRHTISLWFSTNPHKQMPTHTVPDLELNEDSWRLSLNA